MKTHELKTWPEFFKAVASGAKTFEVRRDDRDFEVGDSLVLREWNQDKEQYTGRRVERVVTYILRDDPYLLRDGYCILALGALP
jgi:hypothetical protein